MASPWRACFPRCRTVRLIQSAQGRLLTTNPHIQNGYTDFERPVFFLDIFFAGVLEVACRVVLSFRE